MKKENIITEKFALLNLLRALDGLTAAQNGQSAPQNNAQRGADAQPPPAAQAKQNAADNQVKQNAQGGQAETAFSERNLMSEVIARHDAAVYRIRANHK